MNVVWIEDFGVLPSSAIINKYVGSILNVEHFPPSWLGNRDLRENPELLEEQCRRNSSPHVVKLFSKFWKFYDWMNSDGGLDNADIILIDLNLDRAFTTDRPPEKPVLGNERKAGFFLFHQLTLVKGFPFDRIAFLTANSNDVEEFNSFGADNLLPELICFSKSGQGPTDLGKWLRCFADSVATNLRRGVIAGLCEESPKHPPSKLLELADADQMLRSVPALIRHEGVVDRHPDSIAYALAVPWEGVERHETTTFTYARWMKSCRNALAHRHIGGAISEEELALIAFVALRAGWNFPPKNLPHELLLFRACRCDVSSSRRRHHEIRDDLIIQIRSEREVREDDDGVFSYRRKKQSVRERDPILDLVDFAFVAGVELASSAFSLLAAGLWESLSKEERKGANEEPTIHTNHAATLARMSMRFF